MELFERKEELTISGSSKRSAYELIKDSGSAYLFIKERSKSCVDILYENRYFYLNFLESNLIGSEDLKEISMYKLKKISLRNALNKCNVSSIDRGYIENTSFRTRNFCFEFCEKDNISDFDTYFVRLEFNKRVSINLLESNINSIRKLSPETITYLSGRSVLYAIPRRIMENKELFEESNGVLIPTFLGLLESS